MSLVASGDLRAAAPAHPRCVLLRALQLWRGVEGVGLPWRNAQETPGVAAQRAGGIDDLADMVASVG